MKAQHVFENGIYLLNNIAVAKNPLFRNEHFLNRFKEKAFELLEPLCEIIEFAFHENQWEFLVKMKTREDFLSFYGCKHNIEVTDSILVPESSIILSQEMANLQSGFVKHFNWVNKRIGSLFYRRYQKELIASEEELKQIIVRLKKLKQNIGHSGEWKVAENEEFVNVEGRCSKNNYGTTTDEFHDKLCHVLKMHEVDLEAYFKNLPPLKIESPIPRYLRTLFKIFL